MKRSFTLILASLLSFSEAFVLERPRTSTTREEIRRQELQQTTVLQAFNFPNVLESIFKTGGAEQGDETSSSKRESLKQALLEECRRQQQPKAKRDEEPIKELIEQLRELSPTKASATSPLLQKKWALEWTTEKEINFFFDFGFSNEIGQTIAGKTINNNIEFVRGDNCGFYVNGTLNIPDDAGVRTEFEFTTATLDLGEFWGKYTFPPVGAGWFDTIYLDETLRIDENSRDDILICTPYN